MKKLIFFCSILLSSLLFSQAYSIKLKLKPGETYSFNSTTNMKMLQKMMGQEVPIDMDINFGLSMKVLSIENDVYKLETVYDAFRMNMNAMGQITQMSSNGDAKNPLNKMYKNIVNVPFFVYLKTNGEVVKVEGFEKLGKEMMKAFPKEQQGQMGDELTKAFSEKNIINNFSQIFFAIPRKPVNIGETWENSYLQTSNDIEFNYKTTSKLIAVNDDSYEIDFTGTIETLKDAVFKTRGMEMNTNLRGTSSGKVHLYKNTAWIKNSDNQSKITGDMLMTKPSEMKIDMDMDIKYQSKDGKINTSLFITPPKAQSTQPKVSNKKAVKKVKR